MFSLSMEILKLSGRDSQVQALSPGLMSGRGHGKGVRGQRSGVTGVRQGVGSGVRPHLSTHGSGPRQWDQLRVGLVYRHC